MYTETMIRELGELRKDRIYPEYHCAYCGGYIKSTEIKNGLCPNCSAPIDINLNNLQNQLEKSLLAERLRLCNENAIKLINGVIL